MAWREGGRKSLDRASDVNHDGFVLFVGSSALAFVESKPREECVVVEVTSVQAIIATLAAELAVYGGC